MLLEKGVKVHVVVESALRRHLFDGHIGIDQMVFCQIQSGNANEIADAHMHVIPKITT